MALPTHIRLQIVTPDKLVVNEDVDELQIPGSSGYFGVLPGHTPMLASLALGEMWYRQGTEKTYLAMAYGFAEVLPDRVTILAQVAERADEVDLERFEAALRLAHERMEKVTSAKKINYDAARAELAQSLSRLQVARINVVPRTSTMKRVRPDQ